MNPAGALRQGSLLMPHINYQWSAASVLNSEFVWKVISG